ncbi:FAS1-like dehydratase domain-containing protein [Mesorhizobium yinganensis]|uniref:FAS1-like dehydratase domain-containing protein n=1 Tax=Mesorhizobium yinganensis TaxID=3157707 RepID=UPI0032B87F71
MIRVGDVLEEWEFQVEAGKLREFARAVQDEHANGSPIAPPTFPVVISADFVERLVTTILDLDRSRTVHGEQTYEYFRPIVAGEMLRCRAKLIGDETKTGKRGGAMRIVMTEVEFVSMADGMLVCRETMASIEKSAA